MQKIVIHHPDQLFNLNRLDYVLQFLNTHPLNAAFTFSRTADDTDVKTIGYGVEAADGFIPFEGLCFIRDRGVSAGLVANEYHWKGKKLSSVERTKKAVEVFYADQHFSFDVFNTLFFHISRYEEYFADAKDLGQAGWLEENQHFLIRHQLQDRPVVDELVLAFLEALGATINPPKTTYDLSHDVDILTRFQPISKWVKSLGATAFYQRGLDQLAGSIKHYGKMLRGVAKDPYDSFDDLLRTEFFWKSKHIYFMTGGNTKYDNRYQISDKRVDSIITLAQDRGYEIGLHPSYNAGFDPEMYKQEKNLLEDKLGQPIRLDRQHWLRFSWQSTPDILTDNGITQDASMGYNRYLGFRCGTGFAYHMYDFKNERAYEWKEQPMAFMESAAIHQAKFSGIKPASPVGGLSALMKNFLSKNKHGTHISFNFHNSNFDPTLETGRTLTHFYQNELLHLLAEA